MTRMIEALSETNLDDLHGHNSDAGAGATSIVITSAEAAKHAILEKSFLPHQKGSKREHCSIGHKLEIPIVRRWIEVADDEFSDVNVKGVGELSMRKIA